MSELQIRFLQVGEGALIKNIRLRALKESPSSFGQKYEDVADKPLSFWEDRAIEVNEMDDRSTILAIKDGHAVGMLYSFVRNENEKIGGLGGMWVDPSFRQKGVARSMVNRALEWQKEKGMKRLTFWNTEGNEASDQFYRRLGFVYTGQKEPLESDPNYHILEMEKIL